MRTNNRVLNNDRWKLGTSSVIFLFFLLVLFFLIIKICWKGSRGILAISNFFFVFFLLFFYLLGGSASPPLASSWYLWPPCWFSPKQSIKQIDPVHIVQHMGKVYCSKLGSLFFLFSSFLFFFQRFFLTTAQSGTKAWRFSSFQRLLRIWKEKINKTGNISRGDNTRRSSLLTVRRNCVF